MFRPRIIPALLLKGKGLVKTVKFSNEKYIGDPINAVRIFNDLESDELVFLDITASKEGRCVDEKLVKDIGDEAFMPFGVGGGISSLTQVEKLLKAGAEKVVLSTHAVLNPHIVKEASENFGSQSIVVCLDVKKSWLGKYEVYLKSGTMNAHHNPIELSKRMEEFGAGEIIINSIDNDGMMKGYDLELVRSLSQNLQIPIIACGGAGNLDHLKTACHEAGAHALAAGSMFVFHGPRKAVLINYPNKLELSNIFKRNEP